MWLVFTGFGEMNLDVIDVIVGWVDQFSKSLGLSNIPLSINHNNNNNNN